MHFFNKDLFPLLNKYTIKGLDQDFFDFKNLMEDANIIKSRTYKQAWKNACQVFMKGISLCFDNLFLIKIKMIVICMKDILKIKKISLKM